MNQTFLDICEKYHIIYMEIIDPNLPKRLYIGGRGDSEKPLKIGIILEKRFTNVCISDII